MARGWLWRFYQAGLADVTEHASRAGGTLPAPFSVLFHGPLAPTMPQGSYRLEHDQLGSLELFSGFRRFRWESGSWSVIASVASTTW